MIIDAHAHIFRNWHEDCGHPSREIHWKYLQKDVSRPAAKVHRSSDGTPANPQALFKPGDNSWAGLRADVDFRVGSFGRLEYTVDGEDYYIQYMPVGMAQIEALPEQMLAQMSYVGVDHCVLQAGSNYGRMNDYNAQAQERHPEKFTALFQLDEPMADKTEGMEELDRATNALNLKGIYYQLSSFSRYGFEWAFEDSRFDEFWEKLATVEIPVFFEAAPIPDYDAASYTANMERLDILLTRFPQMRWLLVMGPPVQFFGTGDSWHFPEAVHRAYSRENLQLELLFPITWGGKWDYPYREAQVLIKDLRERYGAHKLIWGSDMPNVERFCTYRQCLDYLLRYCEFLSSPEKDLVLGGNVADLCGIQNRPSGSSGAR